MKTKRVQRYAAFSYAGKTKECLGLCSLYGHAGTYIYAHVAVYCIFTYMH